MMRWKAESSDLDWGPFDDGECVVYHSPSGETHLLNRFAALVLQQFQVGAFSIAELGTILSADSSSAVDDEFAHELESLVGLFDDLGLIGPSL